MDEPTDPLPSFIAAVDQMAAEMPQLARAGMAVYKSYLDEGFSEGQAFEMVLLMTKIWVAPE